MPLGPLEGQFGSPHMVLLQRAVGMAPARLLFSWPGPCSFSWVTISAGVFCWADQTVSCCVCCALSLVMKINSPSPV